MGVGGRGTDILQRQAGRLAHRGTNLIGALVREDLNVEV